MLINGAVPVTGRDNAGQSITPIPSNEQGWGRIQLDRALLFQGATRKLYLDDHRVGFDAGDTSSVAYTLRGVESVEPLKVTLTWTDFPGQVDAAPKAPKLDDPSTFNRAQLVNDLDLLVTNGTATYLGNAFKDGTSVSGGTADRRNNVEQVVIAQPTAGDWTLRVTPTSVVQPGQDFAVVVTGKWASAAADTPSTTAPPTTAGAAAPTNNGGGGAAASGGSGAAGARAGVGTSTSAVMGSAGLPGAMAGTSPASGAATAGTHASDTQGVRAAAHSGCSVAGVPLPRRIGWPLFVSAVCAFRRLRRRAVLAPSNGRRA